MKQHKPRIAPCNNMAPGSSKDPHKDSIQTLVRKLDLMMPVCISLRLPSRMAGINSIPPISPQYQPTFAFLSPRNLGYMGPPQYYAAPTYERPEPPTAVLPDLRNGPDTPMPVLPYPSAFQTPQQHRSLLWADHVKSEIFHQHPTIRFFSRCFPVSTL